MADDTATVDLDDQSQDVFDSFQDLDDDQRRDTFLKVITESQVLWIKDVVDSMEDELGVSTSAPAVAAAPAADGGGDEGEEEEEEAAIADVTLEDFGDDKIGVIKSVRSMTDLGLKEAKSLVDDAPSTIKESLPRDEAEEMQEELEEAGATVKLE